jgi:hypothetical protein
MKSLRNFSYLGIVAVLFLIVLVILVSNLRFSSTINQPTEPNVPLKTPTPNVVVINNPPGNDSWCLSYFSTDFGGCLGLPDEAACIDEFYLVHSIKNKDQSLCGLIKDPALSAICLIEMIDDPLKCELHAEINDYCHAVVEGKIEYCQSYAGDVRSKCIAVANKISALKQQNIEFCSGLMSPEKERCMALAKNSQDECLPLLNFVDHVS